MEPIRIVLVEDHTLMREGTRHILEQHAGLDVVGEAGDGQEALALIERVKPDVAILDIRMPKINGIDVVRNMRQISPETKALMLTAYDDDDYIIALMELGAMGYILKTARPAELVEAVRTVHANEPVLAPAIAAKVARLWSQQRKLREHDSAPMLTPREREVLNLAASGLRNKGIAERLSISVRTTEGHFNGILSKLGVSTRVQAVMVAVSRGWITVAEEKSQ